jgi:lycopene beta-cyclase
VRRFAYVVLGGGCAGLSLATELTRLGLDCRGLLVLEQRERYRRDRTWCHWNALSHGFESAVTRSWRQWSVRHGGEEIVQDSQRYEYREIPSDRFYDRALAMLRGRAEIRQPCRIDSICRRGDAWVVETNRGTVEAMHLFDSRPVHRPARLLQHFVGKEVLLDRPHLDPRTAVLMDFDVPQERGIHFLYVLPRDEQRAFVEATWISPAPQPRWVYDEAIAGYLEQRYRAGVREVQFEESGAIPMDPDAEAHSEGPGHYRVGTPGGLVRPSSGYAFLAIQRWSSRMAGRLALQDLPPAPRAHPRGFPTLDRIFLSFLQQHPERAPEVFAGMFRNNDPETIVGFMTETASPAAVLRVVTSMPWLPFLGQAARLATGGILA